ncbi:MAG: type II and III secretion system protein family protein [Beijerinckiaceae bacterium]|nr:type II and III secretion system protein family protein [Beijerinckiaceae bacterium]
MKRLLSTLALGLMAILSALVFSHACRAQEHAGSWISSAIMPRHITMDIGRSIIVDLPQDAAEIFVANPKVANALVRSPRKLYLIAVDRGQTTVYALDHDGRRIASYELDIAAFQIDIAGLQKMLRAVLPGAAIIARQANGTIILTGTVDSAEEAQQAFDVARAFRTPALATSSSGVNGNGPSQSINVTTAPALYVPPNQSERQDTGGIVNLITIRGRSQVMLKVTVAEIGREVAKQLGITASSLTASWGTFTQFNPFAIHGTIAQNLAGLPPAPPLQTTQLTGHNPDRTLAATLQAFERYGVTRILAEPTVSAVSGESAKLTVGGEIPIPGPSICQGGGCTGGGTIFKPFGVALAFSPTVLSEGRIELHLATEVTELDTQTGQTVFGTFVPGLLTRKNETVVEIPSGGSIASAGLLQTLSRQAINGLPGLLNLPVLGALFRSSDYQRKETELLIVVTPYIVRPAQPNEIAKPTDGFTDAADPQAWLLGRINKLYASPGNPESIRDYKGPVGFIYD